MNFSYVCQNCGKEYPGDSILYTCPECSSKTPKDHFSIGNLNIIYNKEELLSLRDKESVTPFDFFPYTVPTPDVYPVGNTPLVKPDNLLNKYGFSHVFCKLEGNNPSGSFKDRASQLIAAQAVHFNESSVALASTGNAGSAMACAGAAYGLDIVLFVPETAPENKLMQSVLFGASVVPVKGSYDEAFSLSIAYTELFGGINRNTAYNPMTVEGKKSVSIEIFNQYGRDIPEIIYVPVGDGVIYSGIHKGFKDLQDAGLISNLPKLVCCQSEGSNAISKAWKSGEYRNLPAVSTIADSISVGSPASGIYAAEAITENGGWASEVTDDAILSAQLELSKEAGIFVEPAAAASWAGFLHDKEYLKETYGEDADILVLLTGIGFKDMDIFRGRVEIPRSIDPDIESMKSFFKR
ncbi:MAG: pyridoxal-phosphate dependent enzyme [Spirochaetia bacterium]|nr:pyridoxal-phosphate dependent enzyme [Spirochaetia bacterium]MCF7946802.1 pyridoxal-phosphate dependent enzyme [Spirochaetia bacterium]MCF7953185.1 pyridoxal-phosphate dependent enzyme [Spirochaetales bacterium]